MTKKYLIRIMSLFLVVATLTVCDFTLCSASNEEIKNENIKSAFSTENSYYNYLQKYENQFNEEKLSFEAVSFLEAKGVEIIQDEVLGKEVLNTSEESTVSWEVDIPKTGKYSIQLQYLPIEGSGSAMTRTVRIDGNLPFDEAYNVEFSRMFIDEKAITKDLAGNDIRPAQIEKREWKSAYIKDLLGYFDNRLYFYLTEGKHIIELDALQEPMAIGTITLESASEKLPSYADVLAEYKKNGAKVIKGVLNNGLIIKEAENNSHKSDPTLYAVNDNTSAATSPYNYLRQDLNCVGGTKWQNIGQYITWNINIPESGLYQIGFRYKQNFIRDIATAREIYIDGKIPFQEVADFTFEFDNHFAVSLAGKDEPLLFYLEKGEREIKMQVTLGSLGDLLIEASSSLSDLNQANWYLMTFLGSTPDIYKSYNIDEQLPDVITIFQKQAIKLQEISNKWEKMTGQIDYNVSQLTQMAIKLDKMAKDADLIPSMYQTFKDDLSTLGDLIATARRQPLLLDYLFIAEQDAVLPKADVGFITSLKYGFLRFISSFFNDYNMISSNAENSKEAVTVWIGNGITGGRDQAQALNQLIIQDFTSIKQIPVKLQLVPAGTILTATLAGVGPDVALQVSGSEPVNYAMRHAIVDISRLDGFDEIMKRFIPASYKAYEYQGGVYALPETLSFPMLFYRTDILQSLDIDVTKLKTWQDIIDILPIIQRLNMDFALPASFNSYVMFLYQNGGELYKEGGSKTNLDSKTSLDAFNSFMQYYTGYAVPYAYSFEMRFRTGEIPLGISDYTSYNLLQISAPEIQGKWGMTTLPGTLQKDGSILNCAPASGAGCVLMTASKQKENAWEFMKWWTGSSSQFKFGKELESVMGAAARYNTANLEALKMLPWQVKDRVNLLEQINSLQGIPEVPGGYMSSRNVDFAIRSVYKNNTEARSVLLTYVPQINQEIKLKREEFGLK